MNSVGFNIGNDIRPAVPDLRFEAYAEKTQVIICKRNRERKKMHGTKDGNCKQSKDERE